MIWAMSPNIRIKLDKKNLKNKISFGVEMRGFSTGGRRENPWSERGGKKREIKKIKTSLFDPRSSVCRNSSGQK